MRLESVIEFISDFFAPIFNQGGDSNAQISVLPTDLKLRRGRKNCKPSSGLRL